ncbi:MAG: S8 family serine peptidase [Gammaproteobacteria bacterium]|nr:S8 family serine peptidase [Gammaproteobacteria bacterium]
MHAILLLTAPANAATWTTISGRVLTQKAEPVCAIVLANGQHTFSCGGTGNYHLYVPLNSNGLITLQVFASGFAPFRQTLNADQAIGYSVFMDRDDSGRSLSLSHYEFPSSRPGWMLVSGYIDYKGSPICAMILINGQSMFSCNQNLGRYSLEVPLDSSGNITLQAFAAGFLPYRITFPGDNESTTFKISGDITATGGSEVDGDVNDPAAPYIPNDTLATPQDIPNPVILGGYVNQPGEGRPGRSQLVGDSSDLYKISVVAGQRITLIISDSSFLNDLDLFLGDSKGNLIGSSEGVGNTETILVPATGAYLIEVFSYSGASSYVLTVGQVTLTSSEETLSVVDEFIPGDMVVRFDEASNLKSRGATSLSSKASAIGLAAKAGALSREVLLTLGKDEQKIAAMKTLNINASEKRQSVLMQSANIGSKKIETIRTIKALRRRSDVKHANPNYIFQPFLLPNDNGYPFQWHYPMINLPQAWNVTTGSNDVTVAVIDTGVILSHPDLQGRLLPGYDFIRDQTMSRDGDGIDADPDDPGDLGNNGLSTFHGTHVAGTIGAATNNATGVSGVTWSTSIMPLRVLGYLGGTSYDIYQAIRYAAGLSNDSGTLPAQRADVINLSLGGGGYSQEAQDLFADVRDQGVIVIAAAGNNDTSFPSYPASYSGVISVSAVNIKKEKASYSNFGATIDVAAPGGDSTPDINGDGYPDAVLSTAGDDASGNILPVYLPYQGTSMASPHVAGVAALMKAVDPVLTPAAFDTLLSSGQLTDDLGSAGRDDLYGYGLINAHKAVVAAGSAPTAPHLVANPASLNFGNIETSLSLTLENGGGGVVSVNAPVVAALWLTVIESDVDSNNNGTYTVTVNRAGLAPGTYSAIITVTSSANTISIPVIMQNSNVAVPADAGLQYVLLVDPSTNEPIDAVATSAINGRYSYSFSGVPSGTYLIISGSDNDNDSYICDAGESCGAFLTIDNPLEINVNTDLSLSDFQTGYITGVSGFSSEANRVARRFHKSPAK